MIKSCVETQVWVSKMVGDYDNYLIQTMDKMKQTSLKLIRCELDICIGTILVP